MKSWARELERLDRPRIDEADLVRSLNDLAGINRWLGGYRALRIHLEGLPDGERRRVRILDVGAGDGSTLLHLREWAPDGWRFVGVDVHPQMIDLARKRSRHVDRVDCLRADGLRLPFDDGVFDAALCTLTLHHFDAEGAVALVREMARVSREKVVVNDLERSVPHYLGALMLARTVWRDSPITRHDAPLSVRRSFTADELRAVGRGAELRDLRVRRHAVFRLVLDGRPGEPRTAGER